MSHFLAQIFLTILAKTPTRFMKKLLWLLQTHPDLGDHWGYSIRQVHYYEPFPDFAKLDLEKVLQRRLSKCIDWDVENQLDFLNKLINFREEIEQILGNHEIDFTFDFYNSAYQELDAVIYYAILRKLKPSKIIEIGCGYSTQIASLALVKNEQEGQNTKIICVEPYPQPKLTQANLNIELIPQPVETIDLSFFEQLSWGDILFIDSTHTVKFGSDVCRELLEILPHISSGVFVHFHDIFFPYDYPPQWLIKERRAWNEQYMLEAFLAYNSNFEIVLANHLLSVDYPQEVAKLWPAASQWKEPYHHCGGLWLRKK